jgi:hypothetical protein
VHRWAVPQQGDGGNPVAAAAAAATPPRPEPGYAASLFAPCSRFAGAIACWRFAAFRLHLL